MTFKITNNYIQLGELATSPASPPPSGHWFLYFLSDGLYIMDDAGTETNLGESATGGGGQEWSAEYATYNSFASSGGTVIPFDDTIPQVTEGSQILTLTFTPLTDTIEIETAVPISFATNDARGTVAIFKDGAANAIAASMAFIANSYLVGVPIVCKKRVTVTPSVSTVISVRVGPGSGTGTMYVNGNSANRIYGGVLSAYLKVREVVAGA